MSLGFVSQSLNAIVSGIVESIKIAHNDMKLGHMVINQGNLFDANINRSPSAYLNNPADERKKCAAILPKIMIMISDVHALYCL